MLSVEFSPFFHANFWISECKLNKQVSPISRSSKDCGPQSVVLFNKLNQCSWQHFFDLKKHSEKRDNFQVSSFNLKVCFICYNYNFDRILLNVLIHKILSNLELCIELLWFKFAQCVASAIMWDHHQKKKSHVSIVFVETVTKCFSNFSCMFLNPNNFCHLNFNCSNLLDVRNLQEQVKKHSVTKNCSDLLLF